MYITIDISLYPLAEVQYKSLIWDFVETLKQYQDIKVVTNGMSTQVFGDYDIALNAVNTEMKHVHQQTTSAIFITKIIAADRQRDYQN